MVLAEVPVGHELLGPLDEVSFLISFLAGVDLVDCGYVMLQFVSGAIVVISGRSVLIDIHGIQPNLRLSKRGLYAHPIIFKHAVGHWPEATRGIHEALFLCLLALEVFLKLIEFKLRVFNK